MVFWWTGRGYLSLLFLIGVVGLFGLIVTIALDNSAFEARPWLWGVALILAAIVNWIGGSKLNRRPIKLPMDGFKTRLFYRARNRFVSLPMEVWSLPLGGVGLAIVLKGGLGV